MEKFAVFGNPISHSWSPRIHQLFSEQTGIVLEYEAILAPLDKDNFEFTVRSFFKSGAKGANITMPFKEQAYTLATRLTDRALLAGAINTLKIIDGMELLGDNTDGVGLVNDLQRLAVVNAGERILLLGAGGAARGALPTLLTLGCQVDILNRSEEKAQILVDDFSSLGNVQFIDESTLNLDDYQLIINATSAGIETEFNLLPNVDYISEKTACYDMFYHKDLTPFLSWCQQKGAKVLHDGLGMLVEQAAQSFLLWYGILPSVEFVIQKIRQEMMAKSD